MLLVDSVDVHTARGADRNAAPAVDRRVDREELVGAAVAAVDVDASAEDLAPTQATARAPAPYSAVPARSGRSTV